MRYLSSALIALWMACLSPLPGRAQDKPIRLNLGYSSISGSQAILRVIKDAGIFQRNGLDVSLVLIAGGSGIVQALVAGDLPIAVVSGEPSILARLQGADTVILGGLINIIDFSIITAPEIKRPQELKGRKLAVSRFGSSTDFVVRYALEKWGLVPDRDVAILQIGSQPARFTALRSGIVHGTIVGPPANIVARKAGFNELATPEQLNLAYPNTSIVSTMDAFARLGEVDMAEETYGHYKEIYPRVPYPDVQSIQNVLNEISRKDPKAKGVKAETFMDTRFLKELEASGLVQKLYR